MARRAGGGYDGGALAAEPADMTLPDSLTERPDGAVALTGHRVGLDHLVRYYNESYWAGVRLEQSPPLSLAHVFDWRPGLSGRPRAGPASTGRGCPQGVRRRPH